MKKRLSILFLFFFLLDSGSFAKLSSASTVLFRTTSELPAYCSGINYNSTNEINSTLHRVFNYMNAPPMQNIISQLYIEKIDHISLAILSTRKTTIIPPPDGSINDVENLDTSIKNNLYKIKKYPNPASSNIHFDFSGHPEAYQLTIFDLIGRQMNQVYVVGSQKTSIPLVNYLDGEYVYMLKNRKREIIATGRFIVDHF